MLVSKLQCLALISSLLKFSICISLFHLLGSLLSNMVFYMIMSFKVNDEFCQIQLILISMILFCIWDVLKCLEPHGIQKSPSPINWPNQNTIPSTLRWVSPFEKERRVWGRWKQEPHKDILETNRVVKNFVILLVLTLFDIFNIYK